MTKTITLQDRIIKKYNRIFRGTVMWQEHESFLRDSIKETEEETRKEILNEVTKYLYPENNYNDFIISKENWDKLLSITNKEKQ